jgi:hypothetical protein
VAINLSVQINAIGTGSTNTFTGLPFSRENPGSSNAALSVLWTNAAASTLVYSAGIINNGSNSLGLASATAATAALSVAIAVLGANTSVNVTGGYNT